MTHDHVEVRASPVLPVTDLNRALAHYAALGFRTPATTSSVPRPG